MFRITANRPYCSVGLGVWSVFALARSCSYNNFCSDAAFPGVVLSWPVTGAKSKCWQVNPFFCRWNLSLRRDNLDGEAAHQKLCILEATDPWAAPFAGAWTLFGDGPELCQPFLLQAMEKQTSKFYFHWKWFIPLTFISFAACRVWAVEQPVGLNSAGILYCETHGWGYKKQEFILQLLKISRHKISQKVLREEVACTCLKFSSDCYGEEKLPIKMFFYLISWLSSAYSELKASGLC